MGRSPLLEWLFFRALNLLRKFQIQFDIFVAVEDAHRLLFAGHPQVFRAKSVIDFSAESEEMISAIGLGNVRPHLQGFVVLSNTTAPGTPAPVWVSTRPSMVRVEEVPPFVWPEESAALRTRTSQRLMPVFFLLLFVFILVIIFVLVVVEVVVIVVAVSFQFEFHRIHAGDGQRRAALIAGQNIAFIQFFFFDVNGGITLWTTHHLKNPLVISRKKT